MVGRLPRTLQGLGAAILAPATLTILTSTFGEGQARARALGVWSAVASAGASAGALLGGILTDFLSWRWILFVNVPVGMVLARGPRYLPESRADVEHRHLDVAGAVTVTGGLVALVYAIVRTELLVASREVLLPLAVAVVLLAVFVVSRGDFPVPPWYRCASSSRSVAGGNVGDAPSVLRHVRLVVLRDAYMWRVFGWAHSRSDSPSCRDLADRGRRTGDSAPGYPNWVPDR